MRRRWKIALWVVGAVVFIPAVLLAPPTGELSINLTCRMKPPTPTCVQRMRAMGHVWAGIGWLDRAITWYERAATEGDDAASYFHLGWAYEQRGYRTVVPRMLAYEKALEQAAAKVQSELEARFHAGLRTSNGAELQQTPAVPEPNLREDFELAAGAYRKAADRGFAPAMNNLGQMYVSGALGSDRLKDGAALIVRAAEAGNPLGAINAALIYTAGMGVSRDDREATRWGQWNGEGANRRDLAYPTLEHSRMALSGDVEPQFLVAIREVAKRHLPLDVRYKPLRPDPRLPTFQSVLDGLKKKPN
jgi:TPR repeat protein